MRHKYRHPQAKRRTLPDPTRWRPTPTPEIPAPRVEPYHLILTIGYPEIELTEESMEVISGSLLLDLISILRSVVVEWYPYGDDPISDVPQVNQFYIERRANWYDRIDNALSNYEKYARGLIDGENPEINLMPSFEVLWTAYLQFIRSYAREEGEEEERFISIPIQSFWLRLWEILNIIDYPPRPISVYWRDLLLVVGLYGVFLEGPLSTDELDLQWAIAARRTKMGRCCLEEGLGSFKLH